MSTPAEARPLLVDDVGERGLVDRIRRRFPSAESALPVGIGDDAAVAVPDRGALQVLTTDAMVEGIHFDRRFSSYSDIGYKALAVNVSDVAAMGGAARLALLSLIIPAGFEVRDFDAVLDGFAEAATEMRVGLAGGNITRSAAGLVVDVTVAGAVKPRKVLTRAGGRPGDGLYVTGAVGAAAAGLGWLRKYAPDAGTQPEDAGMAECVLRYRRPAPRARIGAILGRTRAASACMDLSDGLADAVTQLSAASGTGAIVDAAKLPIPQAAVSWVESEGGDPVVAAAAGGDDYELLFSVPSRFRGRLRSALRETRGVPITAIGELTDDPAVLLRRGDRLEPFPAGFVHF